MRRREETMKRLTHHHRLIGIWIVFLSLGLLLSGSARDPLIRDRRVLVMDFENTLTDPSESDLSRGLAEMMMSSLINYPRIALIERQDLRHLFEEAGASPTRWYEIGKKADVDYVIVGSVSRLEDNYIIHTRLLSVSTGQIVKGSSVTRYCKREEDLYDVIQRMTRLMANHLRVLAERFDAMAVGAPPPHAPTLLEP